MESFGKSSRKAERNEWENDPNVAASVDICNPCIPCVNLWHEFRKDARGKNLERVTFLDKQSHGIIHQRISILKCMIRCHYHILEGATYLVIALIECFLPGHPVPHSQVPIGQIGKLLNRPGMVVDSVIIRPVPNRRFIDYQWIRLCRIRLRFIGGREEKLFFKLFVVAAFINKALLVLDDVAAPTYMWLMAMRVAPQ